MLAISTPLASSGNFLVKPGIGLMVWTLLVFGITMLLLWRLAFPRISAALDKRQKAIEESIDSAERTREEADEIEAEIAAGSHSKAGHEVGDLLFAVVNLARHLDADPEAMLRATNLKFEQRFAAIEHALALRGKSPRQASLVEMDALWDEAKAAEKG